jgi:hypothetical protein
MLTIGVIMSRHFQHTNALDYSSTAGMGLHSWTGANMSFKFGPVGFPFTSRLAHFGASIAMNDRATKHERRRSSVHGRIGERMSLPFFSVKSWMKMMTPFRLVVKPTLGPRK